MTKPIPGVLTEHHISSLVIRNFIFHIIDVTQDDNGGLIPLDAVALNESQKQFFLERLKETAEGTQFIFQGTDETLKNHCRTLVDNPRDFVETSKQIAAAFSNRHAGNMSSGIFVVANVGLVREDQPDVNLIFLVKLDKKPAFKYSFTVHADGTKEAVIEEIPNSLNENKSAVQKSAVIEIGDNFSWDALVYDRNKSDLAAYFRGFLGVTERETATALTKSAVKTVRDWFKEQPSENFTPGEDLSSVRGRAIAYLLNHTTFNSEEFINTVIKDADEQRKSTLSASLRQALQATGIYGQTFSPSESAIPGKDRKQTYITNEGVRIIFEGDRDAAGIKIEPIAGGRKKITIETSSLSEVE